MHACMVDQIRIQLHAYVIMLGGAGMYADHVHDVCNIFSVCKYVIYYYINTRSGNQSHNCLHATSYYRRFTTPYNSKKGKA